MLVTVIEEARTTISDLQDDLRAQEAAVLDLTNQLSQSHRSRDEASRHAAKTIEGLHGGGGLPDGSVRHGDYVGEEKSEECEF